MTSTKLNVLNPVGSMCDSKQSFQQPQQNHEIVSGCENGKTYSVNALNEFQHFTTEKDVQTSEKHVWDATTQTSLIAETEAEKEEHEEHSPNNEIAIQTFNEDKKLHNRYMQTLTKITEIGNEPNAPFANSEREHNDESNVTDMSKQSRQMEKELEENTSKKRIAVNDIIKTVSDNDCNEKRPSPSHYATTCTEEYNKKVLQNPTETNNLINQKSEHDANQQHMNKVSQFDLHPTVSKIAKQSVMIDTDNTKTLSSESVNITSSNTRLSFHDCNEHLLNELKDDWEQNRSKTIRDTTTPALSLHRESISTRSFHVTPQNMEETHKRNSINESNENVEISDDVEISYAGPGPAFLYNWTVVHKCFKKGNGLLFRLEDHVHHIWGFYNDTDNYLMKVKATFGHESMVEPLQNAEQIMHDANSGYCTIVADIESHQTVLFMRGEYNGFSLHYDATPLYRCQHRESKNNQYKEQ